VLDDSFPVVVFSHGLGGCMEMYSQLCTNMASHGFLVFALEHQDGSGCFAETAEGEHIYYKRPDNTPYSREKVLNFRGPMLEQRVEEVESALRYLLYSSSSTTTPNQGGCDDPRFEKILKAADTRNGVALVGHSFGASTMALVAQRDAFQTNTVSFLDPWCFSLDDVALEKGVTCAPVLSILSESWTQSKELPQVLTLLENSNNKSLWWMPGTVHQSVADSANWLPGFIARRMGMRGKEERRHATCRAVAEVCVSHISQASSIGSSSIVDEAFDDQLGPYSESLLKPFVLPMTVEMAKV
jgi:platelet-activating factor acetylhydrolase